jgi:hypothetical protein
MTTEIKPPVVEPEYTAANIRVLSEEEVGLFPWERVNALAKLYPHIAKPAIERLVQATLMSGWDLDLARQRYLDRDKAIDVPTEFIDVYAQLLDERRP